MGTTNILDLNNRVSALEKAVSGGDSAQANKKDIATEFSATTTYTAGCFVYYQGKLYQFNTDHSAGAWDPTDVVEANVTDQIVSNKAAIDGLTASDVAYDNTDSGLTATNVQGALDELRQADNVMLSDGVTSVEDALDELNESVDEIESNWEAVTLPFTPRKTGILLCFMRINTQGRAFIVLNGTTPAVVDGYNSAQGYITSIVGVTKNVEVSQSGSENVQSVNFSYKAL